MRLLRDRGVYVQVLRVNKLHDKHGHFARAPIGFWGGFVWFSMVVGCLLFWGWIGKLAAAKAWELYCNTWHERADAEASTPIRYKYSLEASSTTMIMLPKQIYPKGCFTGEGIDEIAQMIREGDNVGAIRKLTGRIR